MSLILRTKCQKYLDDVGLSRYHVDISNTSSNNLTILGECGNPLAVLSGVRFMEQIPTTEEMALAIPLLTDFLNLHYEDIRDYLAAAADYKSQTEPKLDPQVERDIRYYSQEIYKFKYQNGLYKLTCRGDGTITSARISTRKKLNIDILNNTLLDDARHEQIVAQVTAVNNYTALGVRVDELHNKLSSCDI